MNKMTKVLLSLLIGLRILAAGGALMAQQMEQDKNMKKGEMSLSSADKDFMMKAADGGMTEVAMGQLALKQASSNEVKQFAQRMVDDHSKANDQLKELAAKKGVTLPMEPSAKHKMAMDKMAKMSGADFDREYMRDQVKAHDMTVSLFEKEARSGRDAETKAWAEQTLPTLREHQTMAKDMAGKMGGAMSKKTGSSSNP